MIIYPKIEMQNGRVVQLKGGRLDQPVEYPVSAIDAAKQFVEQGAQFLHVVDLDGVAQGGKH